MSTEENKSIVRRVIDEVLNGQRNLEGADELFALDYVGHNPASPGGILRWRILLQRRVLRGHSPTGSSLEANYCKRRGGAKWPRPSFC